MWCEVICCVDYLKRQAVQGSGDGGGGTGCCINQSVRGDVNKENSTGNLPHARGRIMLATMKVHPDMCAAFDVDVEILAATCGDQQDIGCSKS